MTTHGLPVSTERHGVGQGGNNQYPYNLILAQRIDASFPTQFGGTPVSTDVGCNGWTMADFSTDGSALPLESALWPPPKPPWAGPSTGQPGMALPMEVGLWHGIGPTENSGADYQNTNVNYVFAKTNTVFAKTNTPQIPNVATIAVGNMPSEAHAHQKELSLITI